ncbi:hypothetical protein J6590_101680 [Homalodisca vitripennis]|nr:hypothetical protein J6590_101680 [Homalodisca vitripennis]
MSLCDRLLSFLAASVNTQRHTLGDATTLLDRDTRDGFLGRCQITGVVLAPRLGQHFKLVQGIFRARSLEERATYDTIIFTTGITGIGLNRQTTISVAVREAVKEARPSFPPCVNDTPRLFVTVSEMSDRNEVKINQRADEVSVSADCKSTRLVSVDRDSSLALSRYLIDLRLRIIYVISVSSYSLGVKTLPGYFATRIIRAIPQQLMVSVCVGLCTKRLPGQHGRQNQQEKTEGDEKPGVVDESSRAASATTRIQHAVDKREMKLQVLLGVSDNFGYVEPEF